MGKPEINERFNPESFRQQVIDFRKKGEQGLRTAGIEIDEILARQLSSAGVDQRNNLNFITRPSPEIAAEIGHIQDHLRNLEPDQYYYPGQDLHLTLLEVTYGKKPVEVEGMVERLKSHLPAILCDLTAPVLGAPILGFDRNGCAVNFVPHDHKLQRLRELLRERLEQAGINIQSRYLPTSAHVSLLRYLCPLIIDNNTWADYLRNTTIEPLKDWMISSVSVTWGLNWYGNRSVIQEMGPFGL